MNDAFTYTLNSADKGEIEAHLRQCDADFVPPLGERVNISSYAEKLAAHAVRFEARAGGRLVGLLAAYFDEDVARPVFISNVSVLSEFRGRSVGAELAGRCLDRARREGRPLVRLQVGRLNAPAIRFYAALGFMEAGDDETGTTMQLILE